MSLSLSLATSDESATEFHDCLSELPLEPRLPARKKGLGGASVGSSSSGVLSACMACLASGEKGLGDVRWASSSLLCACEELGGDGFWCATEADRRLGLRTAR